MKLDYHADSDSLYIGLSDRPSVDSRELSEGVIVDYDTEGRVVGIDIDDARNKIDLGREKSPDTFLPVPPTGIEPVT